MKHVRILLLLAVAAAALMAIVGTASATTITAPAGTVNTSDPFWESEGYVPIDNPISTIKCVSILSTQVDSHGAGVTAKGLVNFLNFTNCTDSWHVTVVTAGALEYHASGGGNATVTWSGMTIEATRFGITCRYKTNNTDIGFLTPAASSTAHATLHIQGAFPFHSGSPLCGSGDTTWTGSYTITTPKGLTIS